MPDAMGLLRVVCSQPSFDSGLVQVKVLHAESDGGLQPLGWKIEIVSHKVSDVLTLTEQV